MRNKTEFDVHKDAAISLLSVMRDNGGTFKVIQDSDESVVQAINGTPWNNITGTDSNEVLDYCIGNGWVSRNAEHIHMITNAGFKMLEQEA